MTKYQTNKFLTLAALAVVMGMTATTNSYAAGLGAYGGPRWGVHNSDRLSFFVLGATSLVLGVLWLVNILRLPTRYKFRCVDCGRHWHLDPGDPLPPFQVDGTCQPPPPIVIIRRYYPY